MGDLEVSLEHDFNTFETLLQDSPKEELNKPRERWNGGNILHGLFGLAGEVSDAPQLMECEHEQWVYLVHKSKELGVDINQKNNNNETPFDLLKRVNQNKQLTDVVEIVLQHDCKITLE